MSISATPRPMRPVEVDGEDYYFVEEGKFESMIDGGELLEHANVFGNFYLRSIFCISRVSFQCWIIWHFEISA